MKVAPSACSFFASSSVIALKPSPPLSGAGTFAANTPEEKTQTQNKDKKRKIVFLIIADLLDDT
jgi:hypothetical protein